MPQLRPLLRRLLGSLRRRSLEREMNDELRTHLDGLIGRNLAAGMSPEAARSAAARSFGGVEQIKERARVERTWLGLEQTWRDAVHASRQLVRHRTFTATVVLTLAVGIGATTAIYGVLHAHLLNPIPGVDANRLVQIQELDPRTSQPHNITQFLAHRLTAQGGTFARTAFAEWDYLQVSGEDFLEHVSGSRVSAGLFEFFGAQPFLGRWLTPEEQASGADDRVVISYAWWQSRFGGDRSIVGRAIKVRDYHSKDTTYTVVGVMPPEFKFPSQRLKYWRLLRFRADDLARPGLSNTMAFAQLAPAATLEQAQAKLDVLGASLANEPGVNRRNEPAPLAIRVQPLLNFFVAPEVHRTLWSAAAAVVVVLLIICANVMHLQLARGEARSRELAVRTALGASRGRIVRQLLVESLLLSLLGALAGVMLAAWLRRIGESMVPEFAPVLREAGLDGSMLSWMVAVALLCGIGIGLVPAWRAAGTSPNLALKNQSPTASAGRAQRWLRESLVVAQVTLAVVLLSGAGLMVRSIVKVLNVDPGLNPNGLAVVYPGALLNYYKTPEEKEAVRRNLIENFAALPGTTAVGVVINGGSTARYIEGRTDPLSLSYVWVTAEDNDYLRTIGARLVAGRWFDRSDAQPGQHGVIVTETFAQTCWPGESALGKRIHQMPPGRSGSQPEAYQEVIGVVRNIHDYSLEHERAICIVPAGQRTGSEIGNGYHIRTTLDPASFATAVRRVCKEVLTASITPQIDWMEQRLYASTATRRLLTWLLAALAGLGLFLAMLGIFGLLWHGVLRRIKEIGIRMALGAQHADVIGMVMGQGVRLVASGVLLGLGGAWGASRLMQGMVFGISPTDPVIFIAIPLLLIAVALFACWLPARRATKVDPVVALRAE